jgi:hypothetical protein
MSARCDCYGTMFPDFTRLERNKPLSSPAFTALVEGHGIGVQGRKLEVKGEGWEKCVACADYRTCYDLSLAKLLMNTMLVNGWYGA